MLLVSAGVLAFEVLSEAEGTLFFEVAVSCVPVVLGVDVSVVLVFALEEDSCFSTSLTTLFSADLALISNIFYLF